MPAQNGTLVALQSTMSRALPGPVKGWSLGGFLCQMLPAPTNVLSRSLYRSHVLTTFFGPVLRAMMKQVCWHSKRSEAHRGLPEARPRTQNVMARGQSEAHGDSNLYNTRPTPSAAMLLWNAVKKHMTASVHLTLTQHCRWGAGRIQQIS